MRRARTAFALCLVLAACAGTSDAPVRVDDAWIRALPEGVTATAGYFTIENRSDAPRTLTVVSSPQFARVELHETRMEDGIARMRPLDALPLPPGERVALAPGGLHLMLLDPTGPLAAGGHATLRLQLDDGWLVEIQAEVRAP
jgi:copper(I)-binding protein